MEEISSVDTLSAALMCSLRDVKRDEMFPVPCNESHCSRRGETELPLLTYSKYAGLKR